jgi:hypothetical protein
MSLTGHCIIYAGLGAGLACDHGYARCNVDSEAAGWLGERFRLRYFSPI